MQRKKEIVSSAHAMVNLSLNSVVVLIRLVVDVRPDSAVVVVIPIDYQISPLVIVVVVAVVHCCHIV